VRQRKDIAGLQHSADDNAFYLPPWLANLAVLIVEFAR
jgi:hypothetical protein